MCIYLDCTLIYFSVAAIAKYLAFFAVFVVLKCKCGTIM